MARKFLANTFWVSLHVANALAALALLGWVLLVASVYFDWDLPANTSTPTVDFSPQQQVSAW